MESFFWFRSRNAIARVIENMTKSSFINKALVALAAASFLGALEPISASAWDEEDSLIVQLDLGNGGGGGGPDPCIGDSSITLGSTLIELSSSSTGNFFPKDPDNPYGPTNAYWSNDRTVYSTNPFQVAFDADSCSDSVKNGTLSAQRSPVLRQIIDPTVDGENWVPAEMTWSKEVLSSNDLRASANLSFLSDYDSRLQVFNLIHWQSPPVDEFDISAWQVAENDLDIFAPGNQSIMTASSGEINPEATLTIFGDNPAGKWKVSFGFVLEVQ